MGHQVLPTLNLNLISAVVGNYYQSKSITIRKYVRVYWFDLCCI